MRRRLMLCDKQTIQYGLKNKNQTTISSGSYEVKDNTFYLEPTINSYAYAWTDFINPLQLSSGDVLTILLLLLEGNNHDVICAINSHHPGQQYGVLQRKQWIEKNRQASVSFTMRSGDPPIERIALAYGTNVTQSRKYKVSVAVNGTKLF